ncbi:hypothetical protein LTR35_008338 [Friedmanniomyces endolithicus]|uniref:Uncharacterized protein n=1 Tax=Friedmanniomyces endolithicus TaxID=329885 RepID=A0AAN6FM12_9PEZI|nr:hypothetical protein LTR35_008338 [Friedmanniomyces endolithicus]KAK0296355.1 hypothetical protein LTS00_005188 [Friedmanniomyces endolithicus]KAK0319592.1 hypothetical protein LTR82_009297 [Friedmanniomyces endolithicus]KAK1004884.1 hypothetical protein LTR54_007205 [Friedmanniomyces endolithicus]
MNAKPPPANYSQRAAQPPTDTPFPPFGLYDRLLEQIQFDREEGVCESIDDLLHQQGPLAKKAIRVLPHLMPTIIRLDKLDLLGLLLQNGIAINAEAVRAAAEQPLKRAKAYLDLLFAHGWDINRALGGSEPPVLSTALNSPPLVRWLIAQGADPNATSEQLDITSITMAVQEQDYQTVELLLQHAGHQQNGYLVHSALQRVNDVEALEMLDLLSRYRRPIDEIQWQDEKSIVYRGCFSCGTPLYYACLWKKWHFALALVKLGADPDRASVKDGQPYGQTPREILVEEGAALAADPARGLCVAADDGLS